MKKKTKCYIYTRVSTAIQVDGYSLDAQKDKLRKYAEFQDMEIVGEYSDEGHSGKNIKGRQEFMRMLNDIEDGKDGVDFVLVFKLSRFGRNAADVLSSLQLMQEGSVQTEQASKSGLSYQGKPIQFKLVDDWGVPISPENLYQPYYGEKCKTCGMRMACNGCSRCGKCS